MGYLNGRWLFGLGPAYGLSWLGDPRFGAGLVLFLCGFFINIHTDDLLLALRREHPGTYQIPHGGMFRWLSCPNYFGELLEWTGWAIATWSLPGLAFALWTASNLLPRARAHHRWYHARFSDYPAARRAMIPYVY